MDSKNLPGGRAPRPIDHKSSNFLRIASFVDGENLVCAVCGRRLDNDNFRADRYGNVACAHHDIEPCVFCGRILSGSCAVIPHYGKACPKCTGPLTYPELETVRAFVYDFFKRRRLYVPEFRLRLLSAGEMYAQHGAPDGSAPMGVALNCGGGYEIHLMRNNSRIGLAKTLAHELTHLWQWHRGIDAPDNYCEGFCNLVASMVISEISKEEALVRLHDMMENPDESYGVAFRELKIVCDVYGWDTVIAAMKKFTK